MVNSNYSGSLFCFHDTSMSTMLKFFIFLLTQASLKCALLLKADVIKDFKKANKQKKNIDFTKIKKQTSFL